MLDSRGLTGLTLALSLLFIAVAGGSPAHAQRLNFCGVVRNVPPTDCIIVRGSLASREDFDISRARPRPRRGATISGTGNARGFSTCVRADRRLVNVTWRRVTDCPTARGPDSR